MYTYICIYMYVNITNTDLQVFFFLAVSLTPYFLHPLLPYVYTHIYIYIYIYIYMYIYIYIYTYIYIYVPPQPLSHMLLPSCRAINVYTYVWIYERHDSFLRETRLIYTWDMTYELERHGVWMDSRDMECSHTKTRVTHVLSLSYGVATISRLLKIIGLFCERAL